MLVSFVLVGSVYAKGQFETDDFKIIEKKALELTKKYGAEKVLLVFDIDNTLLAMNQDLGSDQWWGWQDKMFWKSRKAAKKPAQLVVKTGSFGDLLEAQGLLFSISGMRATQPDLPQIVKDLQAKGLTTLLLTSRGHDFRSATERELKKNGFDFKKSALPPKDGFGGTFLPFNPKNIEAQGFDESQRKALKLKRVRASSYQNGIMMNAGQHKGAMLKVMLNKANKRFAAIIFVDDHKKHTDRVFSVYKNSNVDINTYRYSREDAKVNSFKKSKKKQAKVTAQWNSLQETIKSMFK